MRAMKLIERYLSSSLLSIHIMRLKAVFWAVRSLISGGRLSLTAIGRASRGPCATKHNIKRIDRLLGNRNLHKEIVPIYRAISQLLVGTRKRPVILIDWTPAGGDFHAIVAAIPTSGRALPILAEVYPVKNQYDPYVEKRFLKRLRDLLPQNCCPIIVTDAGFTNAWFKKVIFYNWDYIGRVRGKVKAHRPGKENWIDAKSLYRRSTSKPSDTGWWELSKGTPLTVRLVLYKNHRRKRMPRCQPQERKARARAYEPWLLATSINKASEKKVVSIYKKRMQIEETFRDTKNHRYGWCFEDSRSGSADRIAILLLFCALAMLAVVLVGQAAENAGMQRQYQANTIRKRRVLSLFVLGKCLIQRGEDLLFIMKDLEESLHAIQRHMSKCESCK